MSAPPFEPLDSLRPARRRLTVVLLQQGFRRAEIEEMLTDYARELADEGKEPTP
ncbi:hypothetical protein OG481_02095 [Streptomyces longwoodensis]|uniref:hypothetical protein n=1 Tax=Streptomyces longwoodensis TaxID=68231 RepID=UPI002DD8C85C|nr:hypothetical protein [Streptomyces longwoodensis]WRY87384.1 hypothetical protein OG481_02095 [Streptomyces longwoodensis]